MDCLCSHIPTWKQFPSYGVPMRDTRAGRHTVLLASPHPASTTRRPSALTAKQSAARGEAHLRHISISAWKNLSIDPGLEQVPCGERRGHDTPDLPGRPPQPPQPPDTGTCLSEGLENKWLPVPLSSVDVSKAPMADAVAFAEVLGRLDHVHLPPEKAVLSWEQQFLLRSRSAGVLGSQRRHSCGPDLVSQPQVPGTPEPRGRGTQDPEKDRRPWEGSAQTPAHRALSSRPS